MSRSAHSDLSCLDCHVPGEAQQDKYDAAERDFYRLGCYEGYGEWIETTGNDVCLNCHDDIETSNPEKTCWDCHMPVGGVDDFVLVKDKNLPPKGDNIRLHKRFPHRSHLFMYHVRPEKNDITK